MNTNNVFTEMTNYDIFLMNKNKKKAESKLFGKQQEEQNISYEKYRNSHDGKNFEKRLSYTSKKNPINYETYLLSQLNRNKPEKILNEEEFYGNKVIPKNKVQNNNYEKSFINKRSTNKEKKGSIFAKLLKKLFGDIELKKGSKIFIIFYVLIVVAVASTLIVTNTIKSDNLSRISNADTSQENLVEGEVKPMIIESNDDSDNNWFDKFCDSLNK